MCRLLRHEQVWYQECSICPNLAIKPQTPSFTQPPLQVLTVSWPQILCSTLRSALLCLPQRTEAGERRYLFNRYLVCTFMWQVAFGDGVMNQADTVPTFMELGRGHFRIRVG